MKLQKVHRRGQGAQVFALPMDRVLLLNPTRQFGRRRTGRRLLQTILAESRQPQATIKLLLFVFGHFGFRTRYYTGLVHKFPPRARLMWTVHDSRAACRGLRGCHG